MSDKSAAVAQLENVRLLINLPKVFKGYKSAFSDMRSGMGGVIVSLFDPKQSHFGHSLSVTEGVLQGKKSDIEKAYVDAFEAPRLAHEVLARAGGGKDFEDSTPSAFAAGLWLEGDSFVDVPFGIGVAGPACQIGRVFMLSCLTSMGVITSPQASEIAEGLYVPEGIVATATTNNLL